MAQTLTWRLERVDLALEKPFDVGRVSSIVERC